LEQRLLRRLLGVTIAAGLLAALVESRPFALEPPMPAARTASQVPKSGGTITWDFETGNLSGWIPTGVAFRSQPTFDDNTVYRKTGPANIQGRYWIGTFEAYRGPNFGKPGATQGDGPTGTLTSISFTIPPSLTFRVGGGSSRLTRVELFVPDPDGARSVASASGRNTDTMQDVTWDLRQFAGQQGFIRISDESSGPWGHINVDDFRLGRLTRGADVFRGAVLDPAVGGRGGGRGGGGTGTKTPPTSEPPPAQPPPTPAMTKVPRLYGLTPGQADALLGQYSLKGTQTGTEPTGDKPGTVFKQTHQPNTPVPVGTVIGYTIATPLPATVPHVVGRTDAEATAILNEAHLNRGKVSYQPSSLPKGQVIDQSMKAGTSVAPGSAIDLTLAVPIMVDVPRLEGRPDSEAHGLLKDAGLVRGKVTQEESRRMPGSVISQTPPAGRRVDIGTSVGFVTAKPVTVLVPDLVSRPEAGARQLLQNAELVVNTVTKEESRKPLGSVLSQDPSAGKRVDIGTPVSFVTAKPVTVAVPNLVELQEADARAALRKAELVIGTLTLEESRAAQNSVLRQSVPAGDRVDIGTSIDVVTAKTVTVPVPELIGISEAEAKQRLTSAELQPQPEFRESPVKAGTVLEQNTPAGQRVEIQTAIGFVVAVVETVEMKNVVGMTVEEATRILQSIRLTVGSAPLRPVPSDSRGIVLDQSAAAGTRVPIGTGIVLTQSTPAMVPVPDLRSRTRNDASSGLTTLGLRLGPVASRWSYATHGRVIDQSVLAGTRVEFGSVVGITEANAIAAWSATGGGSLLIGAAGLLEIRRRRRNREHQRAIAEPPRDPARVVPPISVTAEPHPKDGHVEIETSGDKAIRLEVRLKPVRDGGTQVIDTFGADVIKSERRISPGQKGTS
jgi:beta-lactam-binding protein with PASTA domain